MSKNETLKMVTIIALCIDVFGYVLSVKYGLESFSDKYLILWAASLIWIVLFVLVNLFNRKKKINKETKTRQLKVYDIKY